MPVYAVEGLPRVIPMLNRDRNRPYPLPMLDPIVFRALRRLIDRFRPDVVHAHGWSAFTALHLDVPLVVTLHDYGLVCPKRNLLHFDNVCVDGPGLRCIPCGKEQYGLPKSAATLAAMQLEGNFLRRADFYMADSTFLRDAYLRFTNISPERIEIVPGFHSELDDGTGAELERPSLPPKFILFLGNLTRPKGVHVVLEAYRDLETDIPLVLIGPRLESLNISDSRVVTIDSLPRRAAMDAMQRCLFAVVPPIWPEPFGLTAVEAMSCGKAVIASASGGLLDIVVPDTTGLLVPPGDSAALAAAMRALLVDSDARDRLGEAGRLRLAEKFSAQVVVNQIESVYRTVAARA